MINFNTNHGAETTPSRAIIPDYRLDLPAIVRQIRVCRSTLGAILDELESADHCATSVEQIGECATSMAGEVEALWELIKRSN